jgi:hypothetical protein
VQFWLGSHMPGWLGRTDVPLMVSHRTLSKRKSLPRARAPWVLDSGGFSEISLFGEWRTQPREYVAAVRRYINEIGSLEWAATQDWMCEPWIVEKTGLSIIEHQARSVSSFLDLTQRAPEMPWLPVLQGWEADDYLHHRDMYEAAGVRLTALPLVGIGSVCRRQSVRGTIDVLVRLSADGIQLHGFGLKTIALRSLSSFLASSDSLAWSYVARREKARCGNPSATCANHMHYALSWRDQVLSSMGTAPLQFGLPLEGIAA